MIFIRADAPAGSPTVWETARQGQVVADHAGAAIWIEFNGRPLILRPNGSTDDAVAEWERSARPTTGPRVTAPVPPPEWKLAPRCGMFDLIHCEGVASVSVHRHQGERIRDLLNAGERALRNARGWA